MTLYTPQFRQTSFVSSREDLSTIPSAFLASLDCNTSLFPNSSAQTHQYTRENWWQQENLLTCVRAKGCDTWLTNTCRSFPLRSQLSMRSRCASTQYILKAQGKRWASIYTNSLYFLVNYWPRSWNDKMDQEIKTKKQSPKTPQTKPKPMVLLQ